MGKLGYYYRQERGGGSEVRVLDGFGVCGHGKLAKLFFVTAGIIPHTPSPMIFRPQDGRGLWPGARAEAAVVTGARHQQLYSDDIRFFHLCKRVVLASADRRSTKPSPY
jgi:hypothetical protein